MAYDFDLIVIGSGAGGGVGAHVAAGLGKKVAVVERDAIGGECPNYACVPTKALLHAAEVYRTVLSADQYGIEVKDVRVSSKRVRDWKRTVVGRTGASHGEKIFSHENIVVLTGEASFINPHEIRLTKTRHYTARYFLVASGSEVIVPPIPGLDPKTYLTFRDAIELDELPRSIFILGGGPIGCEFAEIFASFGVAVTIADIAPRLLARDDPDVGNLIGALFTNRGIKVLTESAVTRIHPNGANKTVHYRRGGRDHTASVEEIFVASGKRPAVAHLDLERAAIAANKHGIKVNQYLQTSQPHIYAAGDVIGPYLYTPTGSYQSAIAVNNIFSRPKIRPNYAVVPRCVFISPEVAGVGLTEAEAKARFGSIKRGVALIAALGRANTANSLDGFVKVITDQRGRLLGGTIVAPRAGEIIHELALALKLQVNASDIANMIHAYPTFSEGLKYACASLEAA